MKKLFLVCISFFIATLFITGCGPSYVVVGTRPAPPVYERPFAPGPGYVWIEGEWVVHRGGYVYKRGYWAPPRRRYHHYMPGHWEQTPRGWYWRHGYWNY